MMMTEWFRFTFTMATMGHVYRQSLQRIVKHLRVKVHAGISQHCCLSSQPAVCQYHNNQHEARLAPALHSSQIRTFLTSAARCEIVQYKLSDIGEGIREVVIVEWFIKPGDKVNQFDSVCEVKSDKASVTITSRYDGIVTKLYHEVDAVAFVGQPLIDIDVDKAGVATKQDDLREVDIHPVQKDETGAKAVATPAVRRLAMENKITLSDVKGTGKDGRVLKEDVIHYLEDKQGVQHTEPTSLRTEPPTSQPSSKLHTPPPPTTAAITHTAEPPFQHIPRPVPIGEDKTVPLKGVSKAMFRVMSEAIKIPPFGYYDDVDVSQLVELRKRLKPIAQGKGIQLSYMPIFIKAVSLSLLEYPILNSTLDATNEQVTYKAAHNIGVAMDTPEGLLVPNIKNVQGLTIFEIAGELNRLQSLGLAGKLGTTDLAGTTFSLSNIGAIGGTYARPVVMPPNVAIGAVGKIQILPRFDEKGEIKKAHIMNVSWTADHRVVDGATMARFSNLWKEYLQEPTTFLLNLK